MVYTPLLACRRQYQRRPLFISKNFHAERSSPQKAGDLHISNSTILNTFKFAGRRDLLIPLSIGTLTLTKIQSKALTRFPFSNTLNSLQTSNFNHYPLRCRGQTYSLVLALRWTMTLLSYEKAMLRVAFRRTYKIIPTTHLRSVKSTNISSVGSRRRAWRRTVTTCWRKKTPLCVSQASNMDMASRCSWLACQMIRISGSGNYTVSRILDGMTITNTLSNTGVETSSKPQDDR